MRVIVIGLGSMGKRRIRLLRQINKSIEIIGVDSREDRATEVRNQYEIDTVDSLEKATKKECDAVFVCTSPLSHADIIESCLMAGLNVFTEINLVKDKYDENIVLAKKMNKILFLSSTFLYRDEIKYIENQVKSIDCQLTYNYHIGQYLPDWHPWESYTDYFIGDARTNGCREIMAIDLPWIYRLFGKVKRVEVAKAKKTRLSTNYDDSYIVLLEHENGVQGSLLVDVVSRKAVRNLEIFGEELYISWDGSANGLRQYDIKEKIENNIQLYDKVDRQEEYASFVVENAYKSEIETFLSMIEGVRMDVYDFEDDKYVLDLIDKIEGK